MRNGCRSYYTVMAESKPVGIEVADFDNEQGNRIIALVLKVGDNEIAIHVNSIQQLIFLESALSMVLDDNAVKRNEQRLRRADDAKEKSGAEEIADS